jgi:hypothetical protein
LDWDAKRTLEAPLARPGFGGGSPPGTSGLNVGGGAINGMEPNGPAFGPLDPSEKSPFDIAVLKFASHDACYEYPPPEKADSTKNTV